MGGGGGTLCWMDGCLGFEPRMAWRNILFYFTNGRYIECLSLTYATDKSETEKKFTLLKKRNIQSKYTRKS